MSVTNRNNTLALVIVVAIGFLLVGVLTAPDQRTTGQRIGDAIDALPEGPEKAAEQLERRTPGEKLGDAVEEVGEDIKRNTDRN